MPRALLEKTIKRVTEDYLQLADAPGLSAAVRAALESRIHEARTVFDASEQSSKSIQFKTVESALGYALEKASSKILEEHDIVSAISLITKAHNVYIGTIEEFHRLYLNDFNGGQGEARDFAERLAKGDVVLTQPPFDQDMVQESRADRVVACRMTVSDEGPDARYLFAVTGPQSPAWVESVTLTALVTILSQRLREREARQLSEVGAVLSHIGLALDPQLAHKASLRHSTLVAVKARLEAAKLVHDNLLDSLRQLLSQTGQSPFVDRIESRVKSADSVVRKMLVRRMSGIDNLDDLVGVRIVVLSKNTQARICELIAEGLRAPNSGFGRKLLVDAGNASVDNVVSDEGYRSVHICFSADSRTGGFLPIGCEIQVRTIFEDAWARVSQLVRYKRDGRERKSRGLLRELARIRDDCDALLDASD